MQHVLEIAVISARGDQCSNAMSGITIMGNFLQGRSLTSFESVSFLVAVWSRRTAADILREGTWVKV